MLVYKKGDILKATENIICHQVNIQGVMGGGLAKQIASIYPKVEDEYKKICKSANYDYNWLKGVPLLVEINDKQFVANCFTQKPNFDTDYEALKECFKQLLNLCKHENVSICIPYKYGCGIANGKWEEVETILRSLSGIYQIDISIYKLED
jgi:O-acetyl-ADP-ribose deacetylase (regulator of RNase III)